MVQFLIHMKDFLQHIWKGWRIERLDHPWCDKALFGFRAGVHILLYIDLSALAAQLKKERGVTWVPNRPTEFLWGGGGGSRSPWHLFDRCRLRLSWQLASSPSLSGPMTHSNIPTICRPEYNIAFNQLYPSHKKLANPHHQFHILGVAIKGAVWHPLDRCHVKPAWENIKGEETLDPS